jgi:hypothetical protein
METRKSDGSDLESWSRTLGPATSTSRQQNQTESGDLKRTFGCGTFARMFFGYGKDTDSHHPNKDVPWCFSPTPTSGAHIKLLGPLRLESPASRELCFVAVLTPSGKHRWECHVPVNPSSPFSQGWEFTSGKFAFPSPSVADAAYLPTTSCSKKIGRDCFMAMPDHEPTTWKKRHSSRAW